MTRLEWLIKQSPMFKWIMVKQHIYSPRAKSGSSVAASDISVSFTSWLTVGSSIDIARACCSRAFSSSCFHVKVSLHKTSICQFTQNKVNGSSPSQGEDPSPKTSTIAWKQENWFKSKASGTGVYVCYISQSKRHFSLSLMLIAKLRSEK